MSAGTNNLSEAHIYIYMGFRQIICTGWQNYKLLQNWLSLQQASPKKYNKNIQKNYTIYIQLYTVPPFWIYLFCALHACFSAILYWISSHVTGVVYHLHASIISIHLYSVLTQHFISTLFVFPKYNMQYLVLSTSLVTFLCPYRVFS